MSIPQCLMRNRHGSVWYARIHVPHHLRPLLNGRREVRKSTGTTDERRASRFAALFWAECQAFFDTLEQAVAKKRDNSRIRNASGKSQHLKVGYMTVTDALGASHTLDFGGTSSEAAALMEREEAQKIRQAALDTIKTYKDQPELLAALLTRNTEPVRSNQSFGGDVETPMIWTDLFETYEKQERKRAADPAEKFSDRTFLEYGPHRNLWRDYFDGRMVDSIKRSEINQIETWLRNFPTNITKKKIALLDAIELARSEGHEMRTLSGSSYNHYQRQIAGLLRYAYKIGAHPNDLSGCVQQMNAKLAILFKKLPFNDQDISRIFDPGTYIGNLGKNNERSPIHAKFWIPLILAYTGARLEEICQLKVSDVLYDKEADCNYFNILGETDTAPDEERKRVKNKNSIRPIPIHTKLIDIGFLEYLNELKSGPSDSSLFGLSRGSDGKFGAPISKWFTNKSGASNGFIERCGILSHGVDDLDVMWSKSLHSFRHTVVDNLRDKRKVLPDGSRMTDEDTALVVGHIDDAKRKIETGNYGIGHQNMPHRKDVVELISYKWVDFDKIKWRDLKKKAP